MMILWRKYENGEINRSIMPKTYKLLLLIVYWLLVEALSWMDFHC